MSTSKKHREELERGGGADEVQTRSGGAEEQQRSLALYVRTEGYTNVRKLATVLTCLPPNPRSRKFPAMSLNSSQIRTNLKTPTTDGQTDGQTDGRNSKAKQSE